MRGILIAGVTTHLENVEVVSGFNSMTTDVASYVVPFFPITLRFMTLENSRVRRRALIGSNPAICGGDPIIVGTRMSVTILVELSRHLGWDVERIRSEFPELSTDQIIAALEYYEEQPKKIDEIIQKERTAAGKYQFSKPVSEREH